MWSAMAVTVLLLFAALALWARDIQRLRAAQAELAAWKRRAEVAEGRVQERARSMAVEVLMRQRSATGRLLPPPALQVLGVRARKP